MFFTHKYALELHWNRNRISGTSGRIVFESSIDEICKFADSFVMVLLV